MENASKALLMAGGILIAILVIGVVIYMFNSSSQLFKTSKDIEKEEQIEAFNREYEAYNRKLLRGTDIISIINKVNSNNKKYEDGDIPEYQMSVEFELIEPIGYTKREEIKDGKKIIIIEKKENKIAAGKYNNNGNEWKAIKENAEAFTDFKRRVFDCSSNDVEYNKQTGRITKMYFKERLIDYTEGL